MMNNFDVSTGNMDDWQLHLLSTVISPEQFRQEIEAVRRESQASYEAVVERLRILQDSISSIQTMVEGLTKLQASLQTMIEAVNRTVPASLPLLQSPAPPVTLRSSPQQAKSSDLKNLYLNFKGTLPEALVTKDNIKDQGVSLNVELLDHSGEKVKVGPESSVKIKVFVVNTDFKMEDGRTEEDISKHKVSPRANKAPLLMGKYEMFLHQGVASVDEIAFTDNSSPMRDGKFRLGAQVVKGVPGVAIKAAVSESFRVKEHRNTFYKKQGSLSMEDEVWHLINIGQGKTHKKLVDMGVYLVKDFLQLYHTDEKALKKTFRNKRKLKDTVEMAKSCTQSDQPIQPQETPDNFHQGLANTSTCTAYEKQTEQTKKQTLMNQTFSPAKTSCPSVLNPGMQFLNAVVTDQGLSEVQPTNYFSGGLGRTPVCTTFEEPKELLEPLQAENACLPITAASLHFNPIIANQDVWPYHSGEPALLPDCYSPSTDDIFDVDFSSLAHLLLGEDRNSTRCRSPRWIPLRAALRFRIAIKVPVKPSPRAGKRQKLF